MKKEQKKNKENKEKTVNQKTNVKKVNKEQILTTQKQKKDPTLMWIFIIMAILIIVLLAVYFLSKDAKSFKYEGLTFTKERFGEIPVYHYYYYYEAKSGQLIKYNLFLRIDPRQNKVPINGNISYIDGQFVYLSINSTGLSQCEDGNIAISGLAAFLVNNEIEVKGATPDKNESEIKKIRYATCDTHPGNVVILVQEGNETRIDKTDNCYVMNIANCEMLNIIEKFEVRSVLDAKRNNPQERPDSDK